MTADPARVLAALKKNVARGANSNDAHYKAMMETLGFLITQSETEVDRGSAVGGLPSEEIKTNA